jgi:hypothetical protein
MSLSKVELIMCLIPMEMYGMLKEIKRFESLKKQSIPKNG